MTLRVVMIAGEASGDILGGKVLAALHDRHKDLEVSGVGGVMMQAEGLQPVFPMEDLTVVGISDALASLSRLKSRAAMIMDHIAKIRPDVIITVDNKGFSLRLGKALKARMTAEGWSVPVVHMVAPTVWAWGSWRAKSVAASVDRLLCLFPFEVPYFTRYGVDAVAVGHPAAEIKQPDRKAARQNLNIKDQDDMLVLLPGSRRREVERLLPMMIEAAAIIKSSKPGLKIYLPMASSAETLIKGMISPDDGLTLISHDRADIVMAAGDYGLICSGTVTLEAALSGLKGHVYYRVDALTYLIGQFFVRRENIVLPNAITGREIYPLSINSDFNAEAMAKTVLEKLDHPKTPPKKTPPLGASLVKALTAGDKGFAQNVVDAIDGVINKT